MGLGWAAVSKISLQSDNRIDQGHPTLERGLWILAVAAFGVGDVVTTTVGQTLGLYETNPIFRALFEMFPVLPVMILGMGLQLVIARQVADRLDSPGRLLIPIVLVLLGLRVVVMNLTVIASAV